ncbi:Crp/Fnr family transcriptional regulator [Azospirillum canadense]|uniref:Crp/Fnr family transcriptional regulator n=1 Tax=Azospirillum canadense TaxID=403962 RepID=UPI0022267E86|nr:Crp/Fnr family transcriptional regulator [Azospirillum canadense]MCW2240030.1 CRP-like cAMP-binding protein [Azospirillum canadense]
MRDEADMSANMPADALDRPSGAAHSGAIASNHFPNGATPVRWLSCGQCPVQDVSVCRRVDRRDIDRLFPHGARTSARKAGVPLFHQGEPFDHILIVQSGWAVIYKLFEDGRRQIIRFAMPGDLIGFEGSGDSGMAYSADAITDMTVCAIKRAVFYRVCAESPRLAMNFASMVTREALAAWNHVGALGQQAALGRVANLLLDLHRRITSQREIDGGPQAGTVLHLPLSQIHIADATGLTPVHVCRTLKQLKAERLLEFRKGDLVLLDPGRLARIAQLDPDPGPNIGTSAAA